MRHALSVESGFYDGFALAILGHAWNNSLPLFMALAAAQSGEAAPTEVLAPPTYTVFAVVSYPARTKRLACLRFGVV